MLMKMTSPDAEPDTDDAADSANSSNGDETEPTQ